MSEKYLSFDMTTFVFKCVRGIKFNCLFETDCEKNEANNTLFMIVMFFDGSG